MTGRVLPRLGAPFRCRAADRDATEAAGGPRRRGWLQLHGVHGVTCHEDLRDAGERIEELGGLSRASRARQDVAHDVRGRSGLEASRHLGPREPLRRDLRHEAPCLLGPDPERLDGEPRLAAHVERLVAPKGVGSQQNPDARLPVGRIREGVPAEVGMATRTVNHGRAVLPQEIELAVRRMIPVNEERAGQGPCARETLRAGAARRRSEPGREGSFTAEEPADLLGRLRPVHRAEEPVGLADAPPHRLQESISDGVGAVRRDAVDHE